MPEATAVAQVTQNPQMEEGVEPEEAQIQPGPETSQEVAPPEQQVQADGSARSQGTEGKQPAQSKVAGLLSTQKA